MKKLLLASNGSFLIENGYILLGIPVEKINIAYITTASKGVKDKTYLERHKQSMNDRGYKFEEIDIENKTKQELTTLLTGKNIIHVEGGNTFYLLKAFRETGFDKILKKYISKGVIYVGTSAGAHIACPTIETATWNPNQKERFGVTDFMALNLVPFTLKVHYTDDNKEIFTKLARESKYPVRILRDGQGILVNEDDCTFFGQGPEVKL